MKRFWFLEAVAVVAVLGLLGEPKVRADGFIHIVPTPGQPSVPLSLKFHKVDVEIDDQVARTTVDEEFFNPNDRQVEGLFLFPVPKGANIDKFSMFIDDKETQAELLDAGKARKIYEDIVRKMKDPALLEYADRDLFKVRIFPISARGSKRVKLTYHQVLGSDAGLCRYVYSLGTERFSSEPIRTVSVKVVLRSKVPIKSVYSPTHEIEIDRKSDHEVVLGYEASNVTPNRDLEIYYSLSDERFGVNLLSCKPAGEDGYFMALLSPQFGVDKGQRIPKDICFVLDTSGSMSADGKLDQAEKALNFCLRNLDPTDRFNVLRFATEIEPLQPELAPADAPHIEKASAFISTFKPIGGTDINDALLKALSMKRDDARPYLIVFLTDGLPTVGETDAKKIISNVKDADRAGTRIFCFGVGYDVNTHLLDEVAETTRAVAQYVKPKEDIEVKVSDVFTKIKEPVLTQIALEFSGVNVKDMYPRALPDLFQGGQLIVVGRYDGSGPAAVKLTGLANETRYTCVYETQFSGQAEKYEFIPRLWAVRKVGYLLDEIRLHGENKELVDEVTQLAKRFGIVTPYTSYLIFEDQARVASSSGSRGQLLVPRSALKRDVMSEVRMRSSQELKDVAGKAAVSAGESLSVLKLSTQSGTQGQSGVTVVGAGNRRADWANQVRQVGRKSFYFNGVQWMDSEYDADQKNKTVTITCLSDEYFKLLNEKPRIGPYLAQGQDVIVSFDGTTYEIKQP